MQTMHISLPETLKRFVDAQVLAGGYSTADAYICELIRADQRKKRQHWVAGLLLDGLESGEPILVNAAYWEAKRKALADET